MFCGVGPLAVKAAVKRPGLKVLANDLNPQGVQYLKENIKLNKVGPRVTPFNMDARDFVRMLVDRSHPQHSAGQGRFDHCFMNLPMDAVEFLDVFVGLWNKCEPEVWEHTSLPTIHVYGFTKEATRDKALQYFCTRIGEAMQWPDFCEKDVLSFHNIRDVSTVSHMYSTSFVLPRKVAYASRPQESEG